MGTGSPVLWPSLEAGQDDLLAFVRVFWHFGLWCGLLQAWPPGRILPRILPRLLLLALGALGQALRGCGHAAGKELLGLFLGLPALTPP